MIAVGLTVVALHRSDDHEHDPPDAEGQEGGEGEDEAQPEGHEREHEQGHGVDGHGDVEVQGLPGLVVDIRILLALGQPDDERADERRDAQESDER